MDVLSLLRLAVRHWRVTAPAVLLTLLALLVAFQTSSPTYQATGSMVLLAPPDPPDAAPGPSPPTTAAGQNPFARYGDLAVMADILARTMSSETRQAAFDAEQVTGYEVVANRFQRGPVVEVTGQGPSPAAAVASTETVLVEAAAVLEELQRAQGADPGYYIRSAPLEPTSSATAIYGSTLRAGIGVLAVGALVTIGLAVLAETVVQRRTPPPQPARRSAARPAGPKAPARKAPARTAAPAKSGAARNGSRSGSSGAKGRRRQPRPPSTPAPASTPPTPASPSPSPSSASPSPVDNGATDPAAERGR
jgi:hypothetical protein